MLHDSIRTLLASAALPRATSLALVILALIEGAQIARAFSVTPAPAAVVNGQSRVEINPVDLNAIRQARLFGATEKTTPVVIEKSAPVPVKSQLGIKLLGVVKAQSGNDSVAILAESGRQRAYVAGDRLQANPGAELIEITANRVLIAVSGEQQYIELEKTK